jgi:hypothetical protein
LQVSQFSPRKPHAGFWDIFASDPDFKIPKALPTKPFDLNESAKGIHAHCKIEGGRLAKGIR